MLNKLPRYAGVISAALAIVVIVLIYALFGTVDLIYTHEGREVYRQDNVSCITSIEYDCTDPDTGEVLEFTYKSGEDVIKYDNKGSLGAEIPKLLITNLFSFKWKAVDHVITLEAK